MSGSLYIIANKTIDNRHIKRCNFYFHRHNFETKVYGSDNRRFPTFNCQTVFNLKILNPDEIHYSNQQTIKMFMKIMVTFCNY